MKLLSGVLLALVAPVVVAEGIERQFESHEHGKAVMTVVLEGKALQIEINSPAANIVGFEHAPADKQQKDALISVIGQLKKPEQLFVFPDGSACLADLAEVQTTMMDDHETDHDHEASHDHETGHQADSGHDGDNHSDFQLSYQFHCGSPALLKGFSVELFEYYPQMKQLQVQLIGPSGQSYQQLDEDNRWINF
ncbi:DUF2796 domain-containing protein [uncultured Amphritea sp.]|uniref:DUF2796 domain-containing protein n=1 Tax=uncultured Amphritea sp. TaxID=981605 RepID=UPI002611CE7A|nr:DUF2796 domain-containing protein [uncultured Amphritea sp.]